MEDSDTKQRFARKCKRFKKKEKEKDNKRKNRSANRNRRRQSNTRYLKNPEPIGLTATLNNMSVSEKKALDG